MEAHVRKDYDSARSLENKAFRSACYAPFVSLFFTTQGRVLACCKNGSFVLGNVPQQRLRDIWNGEKTKELRQALGDYRFDLDCGFCEWEINGGNYQTAFPLLFDEFPVKSTTPEWPSQIEFEGSNTCNFECIMCNGDASSSIRTHRDGLPPLRTAYTDDFFQDLRPFLLHLRRAKFLGGEPLLSHGCFRIWEMMIEERLSIPCHVTTNGSQYNAKVERILEALPVSLSVSIDGATKETVERIRVNACYEQLIENLRRFLDYTRRRGTSLNLTYCLMRQNWHEFGDLLLFAEDLGIEVWINTVIDPSFCSLYTLPRNELARIADCLEKQSSTLRNRLRLNCKAWEETILKLRSAANESQTEKLTDVLRRYYVPDDAVQRASKLIQEGRYAEALEVARTVSESDPCYYYALDIRGYSQGVLGDLEGAEQDLNRALKLSQKRPEAYLNMARIRVKQNRVREARENALRAAGLAMKEDRVQYEASELLAFLFARQGRILQAQKALKPIAELQINGSQLQGLVYPNDGLRPELLPEVKRNPRSVGAYLSKQVVALLLWASKVRLKMEQNGGHSSRLLSPGEELSMKGINRPLVSIIIAFLNAETFLQDAIESVLAQTYENWELLLVDDGSKDGGTSIARCYAEQHPEKIFYMQHPNHENRGAAASRNVGVRAAKGEYVAILDADDVWLPHKLERQVAILKAEPRAAMVCGASLYWHGWTGKPEDAQRDAVTDLGIEPAKLYEPPELLNLLYPLGDGGAPCPSNILLRRSMMERDGGFHEDFRGAYQLYEDQVFLTKIYLKQPVFVTNELWDKYRIHPDSCVSAVTAAGKYDSVRKFFLDWFERYLSEQGMKNSPAWMALQKAISVYEPAVTIKGEMDLRKNKWSLRIAEGNVANLIFPPGDPDRLRIAIAKVTTGTGYDIQLNQPRLKLSSNDRYSLRFRARADRPRPVSVGFAKAGTPWTNLGLYKRVDLSPEWQEFQEEFNAVADEDNGRIHFDLGESDAAVELSSITLSKIAEHEKSAGGSLDMRPSEEVRQTSGADEKARQLGKAGVTTRAAVQETYGQSKGIKGTDLMTPISSDWGWDRGLPIDRYYIERFLSSHAEDIRGCVLEISDDWYTRKFGGDRPTSVEILDIKKENPRATVIADLTHADHIPSNTFDCIILPQTLQYIYDVRSAIGSLYRILKKDGVLLATFPATTRTRIDDPSGPWYWVFTTNSAQRLFEEMFRAESIKTSSYGNLVAATSFLRGLASEELSQEELDYCDANYQILVCLRAVKS